MMIVSSFLSTENIKRLKHCSLIQIKNFLTIKLQEGQSIQQMKISGKSTPQIAFHVVPVQQFVRHAPVSFLLTKPGL